ncbi:MAG: hypothetical protein QW830_06265 [Nitrososphaerales archaeon]
MSLQNPEPLVDEGYLIDVEITDRQMEVIKNIRSVIRDICGSQKFEDTILYQLISFLEQDGAQYSEFTAYMNAFDVSLSVFNRWEKRSRLVEIKKIVQRYCESRFNLYKGVEINNRTIPQAMMDRGASRAKGESGKDKIKKMMETYGIILVETFRDFEKQDKCINDINHSGIVFTSLREKLTIGKHLIKNPDLVLKIKDHILIIEAKHIKESGGAQDKQLLELCNLIKEQEDGKVHYVAFLDGVYANKFFAGKHGYSSTALDNLRKNPNNFFVNTYGFRSLIEDLLSE